MKRKLTSRLIESLFVMWGLPWLAVTFAGDAGMAVCFVLFFAINPLYCAFCGMAVASAPQKLWFLPPVNALLFLLGTWTFFEFAEPAFWLYAGVYLAIGWGFMLLSILVRRFRRSL